MYDMMLEYLDVLAYSYASLSELAKKIILPFWMKKPLISYKKRDQK